MTEQASEQTVRDLDRAHRALSRAWEQLPADHPQVQALNNVIEDLDQVILDIEPDVNRYDRLTRDEAIADVARYGYGTRTPQTH